MTNSKDKKGATFRDTPTLHGKRVSLIREELEVKGIILAKDNKKPPEDLVFKWKDEKGNTRISPVTEDELEILRCES